MRLHPTPRTPLDAERAEREDAALRAEIAGHALGFAIDRYHARMDVLLSEALAGDPIACGPGCATCCHQPLLVSFLELGTLYFSDEARFSSPRFRTRLREANEELERFRRAAGKDGALGVARRMFAAKSACVLLGADDRCSAYEARPFICRNAVADVRCTFDSLDARGFGDLAALGRRLRQRVVEAYELARFDRAPVKVATSVLHLPEGLAWFADRAPKDELRPLFTNRA